MNDTQYSEPSLCLDDQPDAQESSKLELSVLILPSRPAGDFVVADGSVDGSLEACLEGDIDDGVEEEDLDEEYIPDPDIEEIDTGPTNAAPGSEEKVMVLAARYFAGVPLWNSADRREQVGPAPHLLRDHGDDLENDESDLLESGVKNKRVQTGVPVEPVLADELGEASKRGERRALPRMAAAAEKQQSVPHSALMPRLHVALELLPSQEIARAVEVAPPESRNEDLTVGLRRIHEAMKASVKTGGIHPEDLKRFELENAEVLGLSERVQ